jgi:hypothetical protein
MVKSFLAKQIEVIHYYLEPLVSLIFFLTLLYPSQSKMQGGRTAAGTEGGGGGGGISSMLSQCNIM